MVSSAAVQFGVLCAVFLIVADGVPMNTDKIKWNLHEKRIKQFPCSVPQQRAVSIEKVIPPELLPDFNTEHVFPAVTVLYQCDEQSGCCSHNKKCAPIQTDNVELTFRVVPKKNARLDTIRFINVIAANHTQCACGSATDLPK